MNRRSFLAVAVAACSGCATEGNVGTTPSATRTSTRTDTPDRRTATTASPEPVTAAGPTPPASYRASFLAFLDAMDVAVHTLAQDEETVTLRYASEHANAQALSGEIGTIAGGFYREVERGWAVTTLAATILDRAGTALATWRAETAWLEGYRQGDLSGEELSGRILESLEPVE